MKQYSNLATVVSQQLDLACWKDPSQVILANWFAVFQKAVATINSQNIYNMNETGFEIRTNKCSRAIIDQNILKTCYKTHSKRQE